MVNYTEKTAKTKLFSEREKLQLEFVYETSEAAFFVMEYDNEIYWLIEVFETGEIMVSDEQGSVLDKSDRFLNILRLDI